MTTATTTETVPVDALVWAALDRSANAFVRAARMPEPTHGARARRLGRIAAVYEREARWWDVLARWTYSSRVDVPRVYGQAAIVAKHAAQRSARDYRDMEARAWQCCLDVASDSGVPA